MCEEQGKAIEYMMMPSFSVSLDSSCGSDQLPPCLCWTVVQMSLVELRVHGQLPKQLEQMAKLSLLHWSGELYSAFSSPALLYNGLAGISATPTCLDKMSGQQLFFSPQNVLRSHFCSALKVIG